MRHLFLFTLLFCLQRSTAQHVVSIEYEGLQRSHPAALQRLTFQQTASSADLELIHDDLRRLSNFAGIIQVTYRLDTVPEGIRLVYELTEGATRFPIAQLGGLKNNFWWEAGYQDQNWQGRGDAVSFSLRQIDGRAGGVITYRQNYFRHHQWGFGFQLERYSSREPLYFGDEQVDYRYDNHNAGINWKYFLHPERDLQIGYTYFVEDYAKVNLDQIPGPDARRERKHLARIGYHQRRLHYDLYQPRGFDLTLSGEFVFQRQEQRPFYLFRAIWKRYQPVGQNSLLASRLTLGYSANKDTPFAPFVVDSRINIRGSGNRVDRGTAALILNLEYRRLLFSKPWLATQIVAFTDLGSWRNPGGEITDVWSRDNFKYFLGGGLRIISPKAQQSVLRIDYGYGLHPIGRHGVVLGLGQYF